MPGVTTGKKLDLSNLTDEEAKHVWEVVQRDFNLRKKEEDRLGELKTKIEKEDTKRELLGHQTSLTGSYCIRCLQPFKFLVNSKRQCLDCHLYVCKSCSRFNKKENGPVCDPCHMARVLKIGTLEWYHENVRARFKRFGSAKVMQSLFKRLNREHSCSEDDLKDGHERDGSDATYSQHYTGIKRPKRRLTVDPIDFELGCDHPMSRGQSNQAAGSHDILLMDVAVQEPVLADADMASVFHHILDEQRTDVPDVLVYSDNPTILSSATSQLSHSSSGSGIARGHRGCLPTPDGDSEEEIDDNSLSYLLYHSHLGPSIHTSQERLNSGDPPTQHASSNRTSPLPQELEGVDLEEQQLRKKLHEMTENISDHSLTSDEEESSRPHSSQEIPGWRSPEVYVRPSRLPVRPASSLGMVGYRQEDQTQQNDPEKTYHITDSEERKQHPIEEESKTSFTGSTALLVELEDQVAQAAANVQNAQSEVSDIENRIAALNAAGMSGDKRRKSAIPIQLRRLSSNFPTSQVDRFVRNSLYRGSLTQRNPVAKPKTITTCAKPVMKGS